MACAFLQGTSWHSSALLPVALPLSQCSYLLVLTSLVHLCMSPGLKQSHVSVANRHDEHKRQLKSAECPCERQGGTVDATDGEESNRQAPMYNSHFISARHKLPVCVQKWVSGLFLEPPKKVCFHKSQGYRDIQ